MLSTLTMLSTMMRPSILKCMQQSKIPALSVRLARKRAFSSTYSRYEGPSPAISTPPFFTTPASIHPAESAIQNTLGMLGLPSTRSLATYLLVRGLNWAERERAEEALEINPEVPIPFEPQKLFHEQELPACWVMPGRRLAVSAPVHVIMSEDTQLDLWAKGDSKLDRAATDVKALYEALWCADTGIPVSCASWDLWIDLCESHGRDPGTISMKPLQSKKYDYDAKEWKQLVCDPKSMLVVRSPYTSFVWNRPQMNKMQLGYDPIWCFVGHRRLCVQPPYPFHPLVNILGADFLEIHDVDVIRHRGKHIPFLKKAVIKTPACEREPYIQFPINFIPNYPLTLKFYLYVLLNRP
ncbi:hypothetical protein F5884DRAFT_226011 [Xylogone sp. PMI_703]|nr:hypothetical protein F5884DRAFT_226011 [Xylogone sp. PMI_703]